MAIKYSLVPRKNRETGEVRAYAIPVPESKTSVDVITNELTARTTLTRADILAVLAGIAEKSAVELAETRTVRLGDVGSLFVTLRSKGSKNADEFTPALIKAVNIRFRPSTFLRKELAKLASFELGASLKDQREARKTNMEELQAAIDAATPEVEPEP